MFERLFFTSKTFFLEREVAVTLFARRIEVEPTNNRAERDLRMTKVKQKVSGCFRTQKNAEYYCYITSYVKTMANKGYSAMEAISKALHGQLFFDSFHREGVVTNMLKLLWWDTEHEICPSQKKHT